MDAILVEAPGLCGWPCIFGSTDQDGNDRLVVIDIFIE